MCVQLKCYVTMFTRYYATYCISHIIPADHIRQMYGTVILGMVLFLLAYRTHIQVSNHSDIH